MGDRISGHGHFAEQEKYTEKATGDCNQSSGEDNQEGIGIKRHELRGG